MASLVKLVWNHRNSFYTPNKSINLFSSKCGPRLSQESAEKLKNRYVLMRNGAQEHERETGKRTSIPITVRYVDKEISKGIFYRLA